MDAEEISERVRELYLCGKYRELTRLVEDNKKIWKSQIKEVRAEILNLLGWSYYYLSLEEETIRMTDLREAKTIFNTVLALIRHEEGGFRLSAMNGLSLALWLLDERREALNTNDLAVERFPGEAAAWNTRAILTCWKAEEIYRSAAQFSEHAFALARKDNDYLTAGSGKMDRSKIMLKLGEKGEAKNDLLQAIWCYEQYKKTTGKELSEHMKRAKEELAKLQ